MRKALRKQTRKIERAADALREGYDAEALHRLRVAIRRIRSLLKAQGQRRRRRFRRTWGAFARTTNRARDWDVFLEQAEDLLQGQAAERFRAATRAPVEASHQAVLGMLNSDRWRTQLQEWKAYIAPDGKRPRVEASRKPGPRRQSPLAATLAQVDAALAAALAEELDEDDDAAWHRLRIAVKEARYRAERVPPGTPGPDPREVIDTCKSLQGSLGAWHDCVVQLQLLDELARQSQEAARIADGMRPEILRRRSIHLAEARAQLARQSVFGRSLAPSLRSQA